MKKIYSFLAALAIVMAAGFQASAEPAGAAAPRSSKNVISDLERDDNVTIAFLNRDLIRSMGLGTAAQNTLLRISDRISSIQIYVCESRSSQRLADEYVSLLREEEPDMRLLSKISNKESKIVIYGVERYNDRNTFDQLYMLLTDVKANKTNLMILRGRFDANTVATLVSGQSAGAYNGQTIDDRRYTVIGTDTEKKVHIVYLTNTENHRLQVKIADPSGKIAKHIRCVFNYSPAEPGSRSAPYEHVSTYRENGQTIYRFWFPYTRYFGGDSIDLNLDGKKYHLIIKHDF